MYYILHITYTYFLNLCFDAVCNLVGGKYYANHFFNYRLQDRKRSFYFYNKVDMK